jgi:hypothetical protein
LNPRPLRPERSFSVQITSDSGHLSRGMSRSDAKELGDFIGPGQAGLIVVGESKVQEAIQNAVTRAEKQTARDLDVDPKDIDKALQEAVNEM